MSKILLVTWFKSQNYGTILQAYSLYKILKDSKICDIEGLYVNNDVSLLNYVSKSKSNSILKKIKNNLNVNKSFDKVKNKVSKHFFKDDIKVRKLKNDNFIKKYINLYPNECISKERLNKLEKFDYYFTGSDQIWNPNFLDDAYLLKWTQNGIKIAYSSCICVDNIPEDRIEDYKCLKDFSTIMIRDNNNSKKQLGNLLNKKIDTVVDPVLLIGKNVIKDYENVKNKNIEPYVFSYFLGNDFDSRKYFKKFANKNKIKAK